MEDLYVDDSTRHAASNYLRCFAYLAEEVCIQSIGPQHAADLCFNVCRDCPVFLAANALLDVSWGAFPKYGSEACKALKEKPGFCRIYG